MASRSEAAAPQPDPPLAGSAAAGREVTLRFSQADLAATPSSLKIHLDEQRDPNETETVATRLKQEALTRELAKLRFAPAYCPMF